MADASEPEQEVSRGVIRQATPRQGQIGRSFTHTRRVSPRPLARFLAIALEFQLGRGHSLHAGCTELGHDRQARCDSGEPDGAKLLPELRDAWGGRKGFGDRLITWDRCGHEVRCGAVGQSVLSRSFGLGATRFRLAGLPAARCRFRCGAEGVAEPRTLRRDGLRLRRGVLFGARHMANRGHKLVLLWLLAPTALHQCRPWPPAGDGARTLPRLGGGRPARQLIDSDLGSGDRHNIPVALELPSDL
jgi:hypothetical protein